MLRTLAGVSQKIVSRVLNNEQYVSAEVRRRVLAAGSRLRVHGRREGHGSRPDLLTAR
ncbi:LacI family DNA-binding transcriptional regulator [Nonomuraea sp. NPDC052116]|uniref:LacI family DNA-binding transcriptional regulator n=1 Tax=Nonomuraea sp. NPDC052116 TaxID=3155665 RepID=UPI0034239EDA